MEKLIESMLRRRQAIFDKMGIGRGMNVMLCSSLNNFKSLDNTFDEQRLKSSSN